MLLKLSHILFTLIIVKNENHITVYLLSLIFLNVLIFLCQTVLAFRYYNLIYQVTVVYFDSSYHNYIIFELEDSHDG